MDTIQKYFKLDKGDIAFVKFIIEAYHGMAVIRTLNPREGVVELMIAPDFQREVGEILDSLREEIHLQAIDPPMDLMEL